MNNNVTFYIGIDISKKTFDAAILCPNNKNKHKKFSNNSAGFAHFIQWIDKYDARCAHACMEATNIYGNALAEYLFNEHIVISVVNPARIKGFAQSELIRTKNDKSDASLIARFCSAMSPKPWTPEPHNIRQLKAMTRRLEALTTMKQQEVNRLDVAESIIKPDIENHIDQLSKSIAKLRHDIQDHIDNNPDLKKQKELLLSILGIGETTVSHLLSHFASIQRFSSAKKLASYCGVAPREYQSGTSVNRRSGISKIGSAKLRKALFFPAMVALQHNPSLVILKKRMTSLGKPKMVIIGAAMKKLIHIIYGVLKNNQPFQVISDH